MNEKKLNKVFIIQNLSDNSNTIRNFGVSRLGLFGSFVRNEEDSESDIDFLVEFNKDKKNYKNFINLAFFLEELFMTKVDLITSNSLSPYIKPYIIKEVEYVTFDN